MMSDLIATRRAAADVAVNVAEANAAARMGMLRREAHRAPDPVPVEEPPAEPFDTADPHQPPIRTPQNDEPPVDPNPSAFAGRFARTRTATLH